MKKMIMTLMVATLVCGGLSSCNKTEDEAPSLKNTVWTITINSNGTDYYDGYWTGKDVLTLKFLTDKDYYIKGEWRYTYGNETTSGYWGDLGTYIFNDPMIFFTNCEGDSFSGMMIGSVLKIDDATSDIILDFWEIEYDQNIIFKQQ